MSYDVIERSLANGQPIRLYLFQSGQTQWGFCSADRDVEYAGVLYVTTPITDNGNRQTGQLDADAFIVTVPADNAVAQLYRGMPVSREVTLTVRDIHYLDEDALVAWIGTIYGVDWPAEDRARLTCQSLAATLGQPGLRLTWARNCPHALYGRGCGVNSAEHVVPGTVSDLTGISVEIAALDAHDDGHFTGGYIEWAVGNTQTERRTIESHEGTTAVLLGGTTGLAQGTEVNAYPGCPRTIDVCDSRFDNAENYGGVPALPGRSPFDGTPIF